MNHQVCVILKNLNKMKKIIISLTLLLAFSSALNAQLFGKKEQIEILNHEVDSLKTILFELEKNLAQEKEKNLSLLSSKERLEISLENIELENLTLKNEKEEQIKVINKLRKVNDSLFIAAENTILPVSIEEVVKVVNYDGVTKELNVSQVSILNEPELSKQINEEICLYTNLVNYYEEKYEHECSMGFYSFLNKLNNDQINHLKTSYRPIPEFGGTWLQVESTNKTNLYYVKVKILDGVYGGTDGNCEYTYSVLINLDPQNKGYSINNTEFRCIRPHKDRGNC